MCVCKPNFQGTQCDQCAPGHYGPSCQRESLRVDGPKLALLAGEERASLCPPLALGRRNSPASLLSDKFPWLLLIFSTQL